MDALKKRQNLCEKLNMDLNEANELFGEETLQSMQMAKVVGGNTTGFSWSGAWKFIQEALGIGSDLTAITEAITGSKEATIAPETKVTIESTTDDRYKITISGAKDPVTIIYKGDTITVIPEPTPLPKH